MKWHKLIKHLNLSPHPEGGHYREIHRNSMGGTVCSTGMPLAPFRSLTSTIHYLLLEGERSHFHRLQEEEQWFFHFGAPLELHLLHKSDLETVILGPDIPNGHRLFYCIPPGIWFAARSLGHGTLTSCTVTPGFQFDHFEIASREDLLKQAPAHATTIREFTLPPDIPPGEPAPTF